MNNLEINCDICGKNFATKKDLNNHNKAKHREKYLTTAQGTLRRSRPSQRTINAQEDRFPPFNRIIKFRNYLSQVFNKKKINFTISIPIHIHHSDFRILKPINHRISKDDYIAIYSEDNLILKSIEKCYSKELKPRQKYIISEEACIFIPENYIPDISYYNPFNIREHYTSVYINEIMFLSSIKLFKNIIIPNDIFKTYISYNVFYINLPNEIMRYVLDFIKVLDYDKSKIFYSKNIL